MAHYTLLTIALQNLIMAGKADYIDKIILSGQWTSMLLKEPHKKYIMSCANT